MVAVAPVDGDSFAAAQNILDGKGGVERTDPALTEAFHANFFRKIAEIPALNDHLRPLPADQFIDPGKRAVNIAEDHDSGHKASVVPLNAGMGGQARSRPVGLPRESFTGSPSRVCPYFMASKICQRVMVIEFRAGWRERECLSERLNSAALLRPLK